MAIVHISVSDMRPGMYIVDTKASWVDHPYLYSKEGLIRSHEDLVEIINKGYAEAYYDPEQSELKPDATIDIPDTTNALFPKPAQKPLSEELAQAEKTYEDCVNLAKHFMAEARVGKVDLASSEPLVKGIITSINNNVDALTSLAKIRLYDEYTFAHCVNVSIFSVAFGRYLGLDEYNLFRLGPAGLFHDLGKMRVPVNILNAPRRLTDKEFAIMKSHAALGEELLSRVKNIDENIIHGAGQHHEKHNGAGYPRQIAGKSISLFGRIISIADCYDALSAKRVYKDPMPPTKALSLMYGMRGEAWDTELLERFIKMLGIYPVGTPVALSAGYKGIVTKSNPNTPLNPMTVIVLSPDGKSINPPKTVDLSKHKEIKITHPLSSKESSGIDTLGILKTIEE